MKMIINQAIRFAARAHQGQTRKGSVTPYITHPLTVGLILSRHSLSDEIVMAGILHDTIEDCRITVKELSDNFGEEVAETVLMVSNLEPFDTYPKRTSFLIERIVTQYTYEATLVRSADILANCADIILDATEGEAVFEKFKGTKEEVLSRNIEVITHLIGKFPNSPLVPELRSLRSSLAFLSDGGYVNSVDK